MPRRQTVFITEQFYHIYNRSIEHLPIFLNSIDLKRVFALINYYRFHVDLSYSHFLQLPQEIKEQRQAILQMTDPIIEIHAFALMPNHFHFLIKQKKDNGINNFIKNFQISFVKYFNLKNNRNGPLFSGRFKGKFIEDEETFLHVARYIHLNPVTASLITIENLTTYHQTSLFTYMKENDNSFVVKWLIESVFKNKKEHLDFVNNQEEYQKNLRDIKHLLCE